MTGAPTSGWSAAAARRPASWLRAYAQIYFAKSPVTGLAFLAATLVVPAHGAAGFCGLVSAELWARLLGRPEEQVEEGFYGFNGLLVGLALSLYFQLTLHFAILLLISCLVAVIVAAVLRDLAERYIGLPVFSTPFVLVTWMALLAARRFADVELGSGEAALFQLPLDGLPEAVSVYLRSLAAAFFKTNAVSGALIFVGLLWFSRWAAILSVVGFATGYATYVALGGTPSDLTTEFIGFNFVLTAIAVGGVWVVLGLPSIVFAAASGAVCAVISAGFLALLAPHGLPVLAMPFIATTWLFLFAAKIATAHRALELVGGNWDSPERNLERALSSDKRYPDPAVPVFFLPINGRWVVTQGHDGETTHQGLWRHAWDLEVAGDDGAHFRGTGTELDDYFAFGTPVVAPADGKVVRVVSHLEDQEVGEVDTANNWGNLVILWHGADIFSALCHLKRGSVEVKEGETVTAGSLLARVGSSGRSPRPHLHFQLQSSGEIGAQTRHGELIHFLVVDEGKQSYVTHGVPSSGQEIQPLEVDDAVRRAMVLAPGRRWTWKISHDGEERVERWSSEIDPLGNRKLVADGGRARASFFVDNRYTTLLDFEGSAESLLGLFYLGCPRVPYCSPGSEIEWSDAPSATPFLGPLSKLAHDLVLPFASIKPIRTTSSIGRNEQSIVLETRVSNGATEAPPRGLPERIEIAFAAGRGPVSLRSYRGGDLLVSAVLEESE